MIKNRTIPYGYYKDMGKIQISDEESTIIKEIYSCYASGNSYKKIAEMLTLRGVKYMENKPEWNKNMVARILQNEKYLGTEEYPQIIETHLRNQSASAQKTYTHTQSEVIKAIKPYLICEQCGAKLKRKHTTNSSIRWYCEDDPTHISAKLSDDEIENQLTNLISTQFDKYKFTQKLSIQTSREIIDIENQIESLIKMDEIDIELIHKRILQLAQEKYLLIEDTVHLKEHILYELAQNPTENTEKLKEIVKNITISDDEIEKVIMIDNGVIKNERNFNNTSNS